jgi:hypothetical protein
MGDSTFYLCQTKIRDSVNFNVFYKKDSIAVKYRTHYRINEFDSISNLLNNDGEIPAVTGKKLKQVAAIKIKKSFHFRVGMMPQFGCWVGKVRPGRFKLYGYEVKITNEKGDCFNGTVYYHFQKQSFFKRFFKKHRLKKRFKKLPVLAGKNGPEIIFKNDQLQEGGNITELYYTFTIKL